MKKNILLIPLFAFLLASCGEVKPNAPEILPNEGDTNQNDDNKGDETQPDVTDPDKPVNPDTETPNVPDKPVDPDTENPVDPKPDKPVDPDTENPVDPKPDVNPDKPVDPDTENPVDPKPDTGGLEIPDVSGKVLPNGQDWIDVPTNFNTPLDASKEWLNFDCSYEVPENWKYIYGNNPTKGDFYTNNHENISLKFGDVKRGLQTPALKSATKHEIRLSINALHGTSSERKDKTKETFEIYGFNTKSEIVYTSYETPLKNGVDKKRKDTFDIKFYIENPEVYYIEIRLNDKIFSNEKKQLYVNFGCNKLSIKSYNF